jgi:hypothetical protein
MAQQLEHVCYSVAAALIDCFTASSPTPLCTTVLTAILPQVYVDGNGCQFPLVHITCAMLVEILGQPKHDREAAAEFAQPGTHFKSYHLSYPYFYLSVKLSIMIRLLLK